METTKKGKRSKRQPSRQAPVGTWSPENLQQALGEGTTDEKVAMLTELGILAQDGQLAPLQELGGCGFPNRGSGSRAVGHRGTQPAFASAAG
jgi:hypothetical protein